MQVCTQNCIGCSKNKHRNDEDKKNLIKRLNRVEGQVRGISKMVEDDRYCEDVLIQISAVVNSLRSMSNELLKSHLSTCVVNEIKKDNLDVIDDVVSLFNKIKYKLLKLLFLVIDFIYGNDIMNLMTIEGGKNYEVIT